MPEFSQLQELVAIADNGTISKAAEILHLSQPALTRSIQKLEAEWNVSLFDRQKNKVTLNAAGELAVQHARRILADMDSMTAAVQAFERSLHTLSIGSCAPAPIYELMVRLPESALKMRLTSEMADCSLLLSGLKQNLYQIVILDHPTDDPDLFCQELCTERLFLTVPPAHPLASKTNGVYADELAGETMLLYHDIGVWKRFHQEKMSQTEFIIQDRDDAFGALLRSSALPAFATNLTVKRLHRDENRVVIPFLDPEAKITFYCCVQKKNRLYLPQ